MKKMILFFGLFSILIFGQTELKKEYTISGFIKDKNTGEELIGANIIINELNGVGTSSNTYGFYSLTLLEGRYTITVRYIGYETLSFPVTLNKNIKQNFTLIENIIEQKEIVVSGERKNDNITKVQMGIEKLDVKEIQSIPVLLGEKDILKTMQLLPGIKSIGEGNSGFSVRGGSADQNLILLDEATVYSASHFLGFFSVFNSDAIKDVTLYKGAIPAEYGGRLSSVVDIKMNEGNDKKYSVNGGIGLIASRLTVEGPIINDKVSFTISGRRTYADLFLKLSKDSTVNNSKLYFYDLNAKVNYEISDNDKIYFSGYFGSDVIGLGKTLSFDWGNTTGTMRWNHLYNEKMFSNTSLIYSKYEYNINMNLAGNNLTVYSRIKDYNLKEDLHYYIDLENELKFGLNSIYHVIVPGTVTATNNSKTDRLQLTDKYSWENAFYISHQYKPSQLWNLEYGVRLSSFSSIGPGVYYTYNDIGEALDSITYSSGKFIKTYFNVEPRFTINYILNDESSIKASVARSTQNLHLLSNSSTSNPTDVWIPSSNNVKSEIADQVSLGYFRNFDDNSYEFSAETYYKNLRNQIDYKNGAQLNFNENVEAQLLYGSGRAYGLELNLKKKTGRLSGWISYTLSRVEKKIPGVNDGNYYPAKQDRTHDISIVGIYKLNDKWTFSAIWVYYTGNAATFPSGKYEVGGQIVNYYTERNAYRMPAYHRLDLGATWQGENSSWTFSLYNAYGRENAYSIRFQEDPNDPTRTQAVQTALFKFVPSITYNFRF